MPARASSSRSCAPPPGAVAARRRPRTWPRVDPVAVVVGRRRAGPPRPPVRVRRARGAGRDGRAGGPGQGAVRRAGPRRVRRSSAGPRPSTRAGWRRCGGSSAPSRCSRPRCWPLCRAVAARYAGTLGDVLRLAIPPRHATAEKNLAAAPAEPAGDAGPAWARYPAGPSFLRRSPGAGACRVVAGLPRRGSPPGDAPAASLAGRCRADRAPRPGDWPDALAVAAGTALAAGRGALLVVPDHRDVDRVDAALTAVLGHRPARAADRRPGAAGALHGLAEGAARPRAVRRRHPRGDVRAGPRPGARRLVGRRRRPARRAARALPPRPRGAGAAGPHRGRRPADRRFHPHHRGAALVDAGEVHPVVAAPDAVRRAAPRVLVAGEGTDVERDAAAPRWPTCRRWPGAPPRRRSSAARCWSRCPAAATCPRCPARPAASPRAARAARGRWRSPRRGAPPSCRWCGTRAAAVRVPALRRPRLRSSAWSAPGAPPRSSAAPSPACPCTPPAPVRCSPRWTAAPAWSSPRPAPSRWPQGGYAATLLLDAWASLDRPTLDAGRGVAAALDWPRRR